jgi:pimeloyl-ACP methyl ester carboxylesterase
MDRSIVRLLTQAAIAVYDDAPNLDGYEVDSVLRGTTEAFVFRGERDLIIAFRGTDSVGDARLDLRFWRKKVVGLKGTWHRGFVQALDVVFWQLLSKLHFQGYDRRVWITGHSLGGALAVLFAARLAGHKNSLAIDGVLTLGAPRVASILGARWLDKRMKSRILQLENAGDEVTHVPMAFLGYRHVGERHVFGKVKKIKSLFKKGHRTKVAHRGLRYVRNVLRWTHE